MGNEILEEIKEAFKKDAEQMDQEEKKIKVIKVDKPISYTGGEY